MIIMDTSTQYIEMCAEATELQALVKTKVINKQIEPMFSRIIKESPITFNVKDFDDMDFHSGQIWLPRQDQLQELVSKKEIEDDIYRTWGLVNYFYRFVCRNDISCYPSTKEAGMQLSIQYKSMEQLWLLFLMWINYQKVWDTETKQWLEIDKAGH